MNITIQYEEYVRSHYFVSTISELPRRLPAGQAFIAQHRIRRVVGAERVGAACATNQWTATFKVAVHTQRAEFNMGAYGLRVD